MKTLLIIVSLLFFTYSVKTDYSNRPKTCIYYHPAYNYRMALILRTPIFVNYNLDDFTVYYCTDLINPICDIGINSRYDWVYSEYLDVTDYGTHGFLYREELFMYARR